MASVKFKLGRLIPQPADFTPSQRLVDGRWIYQLDLVHLICRRQPKHWDDQSPAGYYRLILPPPARPAISQTLKKGVVLPSLISIMAAGFFLLIYPIYPGLKFQVSRQFNSYSQTEATAAPIADHNRVVIPKIGVDTAILEGPSLAVLNKSEGVWHQKGRIKDDNFVLSGHRFKYLPPNSSTLYNLSKIEVGDTILVDWYGTRYIYTVSETKRIKQNETNILNTSSSSQVTIYTCYDKRQTERIVVIAKPQP
jgi:LPXTG-site transpeptidase (sortase) family protein